MTGLTYGVMAVGVILVFRSTRVINFAIGEMGGFAAALLDRLVIDWNAPFWLSFVAGIAVGAVVGAALELLVVRRLFTAPRVILLVALIGAAQLLLFFQLILPDVTRVRPYPTAVLGPVGGRWGARARAGADGARRHPAPRRSRSTLFLNRTKYGLAIRASAANADAARLAGINIKQMSTHRLGDRPARSRRRAAMLFAPLNPAGASALGVGPGSCCCASSRPRSSPAWHRCRSRSRAVSRSASARASSTTTTTTSAACSTRCCSSSCS